MCTAPTIVWIRGDLRLEDNPALFSAANNGAPVIPVYVWSSPEKQRYGAWQYRWLLDSIKIFRQSLEQRGSGLVILEEPAEESLAVLCTALGTKQLYFNRRYEPWALEEEKLVEERLRSDGIEVQRYRGNLLQEPEDISTRSGGHFRVFTPFWRNCEKQSVVKPLPVPKYIAAPDKWPESVDVAVLTKEVSVPPLPENWSPGELGAQKVLAIFANEIMYDYQETRDLPALRGTSQLSVPLSMGEITPRTILRVLRESADPDGSSEGIDAFIRQLYWREFSYHLLLHEPQTIRYPLRSEFEYFPWGNDEEALVRWQEGRTGYPYIDAAMRELKETGWMHNRARMAVASFLVKDLMISWQDGAAWFWEHLLDADLANNTMGWQWVSGCGADAAPYFRVFNPVLQGKKFDPTGEYVRRWVAELEQVPKQFIHEPWRLSQDKFALLDYPVPMVDHGEARQHALEAYEGMRALSGKM